MCGHSARGQPRQLCQSLQATRSVRRRRAAFHRGTAETQDSYAEDAKESNNLRHERHRSEERYHHERRRW